MTTSTEVPLRIFTEPQQGASYAELLAVAKAAEELGFGAFFRSDHFLKMGDVTGLPGCSDAWVTLAGLARDTERIRLGTLVTPATFRSVGSFVVTAAEVDQMSSGRVEIGLGAGWYEAEHEAFGLSFPPQERRYDLLEDQVAILHGAWSTPAGSAFSWSGKTCSVSFDPDTVRPHQRPHPPLILGGHGGPRSTRLAASYADEYNVAFTSGEVMVPIHDAVRKACEEVGRDPSGLVYSLAQVLCCGSSEQEVVRRAAAIGREPAELRENGLAGSPGEVLEKLGGLSKKGAERFYLQVLDLSDLDHLALVAAEVLPHVPRR